MLPSNYDYVESLVERYNIEKDNASNVHQYISSKLDLAKTESCSHSISSDL